MGELIPKSRLLWLLVAFMFVMGISFGAAASLRLELEVHEALLKNLAWLSLANGSQTFRDSWLSNIKLLAVIWLLGASVVGAPAIPLIIFVRGFSLGFTSALIAAGTGFKGVFFSAASLLPSSVLVVPTMLAMSAISLWTALLLVRQQNSKRASVPKTLTSYFMIFCLLALPLLGASFIDAYLVPHVIVHLTP